MNYHKALMIKITQTFVGLVSVDVPLWSVVKACECAAILTDPANVWV